MRVLISGATGLVGSALSQRLSAAGHEVEPLRRGKALDGRITWDPAQNRIDTDALDGFDAVVHLAGENIAAGRWTEAKRARIRDSRLAGTRLIASALASLPRPPGVFVSASAIGYYGHRPGELLTESSRRGSGFLAETCAAWEQATAPAVDAAIRTVPARFGVVLSRKGGALEKMELPFRLGIGGVLGNGRQVWSWIGIDDVVDAILHMFNTESLAGPVNVVAPTPVTNREFTRALGRVLGRPTLLPMPRFAARFAFGPMADELLLADQRVAPTRLLESGFEFADSDVVSALRRALTVSA